MARKALGVAIPTAAQEGDNGAAWSTGAKPPAGRPPAGLADKPHGGAAIGEIDLESLDGALLRRRWRAVIGRHPAKTLSRALMIRILAWREQTAQISDIDARTRVILAASLERGGALDARGLPGEVPVVASRRQSTPRLKIGSILMREHAGVLHRVRVVPGGFEWDGRTFGSLSAVAKAITRVNWNGRRFFGLDRDRPKGDDRRKRRNQKSAPPPGEERPK